MAKHSLHPYNQAFLALLIALGSTACQSAGIPLEIQDAQLDLSRVDLSGQEIFRLDGQWAFWPGKFVSVEGLQEPTWHSDRAIDRWEPDQRLRSKDPRFEKPYGTLKTGVRLAPGTNNFALQITSVSCALTLMFIAEGEPFEVIEIGQPNADRASEVVHPGLHFMQVDVPTGLQSFDLVIHYSNHRSIRDGSFNGPLIVGEVQALRDHTVWRMLEVAILVGLLLALCFYHCAIYALNTEDKAPLFFSGMALGFTGMLLYSVQFFLGFVQSPSRAIVDFVLEAHIYSSSLVISCLAGFILTLFRAPRLLFFMRFIVFSLLVACGLTFTLGTDATDVAQVFVHVPVTVGGSALLVHLISLSVRRVQFARLFVLSILLYVTAGIHDWLIFYGWIDSVWISQYGCVVFIAI